MRPRTARMDGLFDFWKKKPKPLQEPPPIHVDLYGILGIKPTAMEAEINKAFRELALLYHPDRNPNDPEAERKYVEITNAYAVLSDPTKRAAYDEAVKPQGAPPSGKRTLIPAVPGRPVPTVSEEKPRKRPFWEVIPRGRKERPKGEVFEIFSATPPTPTVPTGKEPYRWATARAGRVPLTPGVDMPTYEEIFQAVHLWPLEFVWEMVRSERMKPAFQQAGAMAIDAVAGAGKNAAEWELSDMFGIPINQAEEFIRRRGRDAFYADILSQIFDQVTYIFNQIKPVDIPGEFFLDWDPSGKTIELIYAEQAGRRR